VSLYQKGKTNLDFTEARDSEWQWHQLGHMQACTSLQTDYHASTSPLSFLQAGCPSCRPTNSIKALKATVIPLNISTENQRAASMCQLLFFLAEYAHLRQASQVRGSASGAQCHRAASVRSADIT